MNNNYKCKFCRDTGKRLLSLNNILITGFWKNDKFHETSHLYKYIKCNCVEVTNLTTEEDLNNNLMRIEVKINV